MSEISGVSAVSGAASMMSNSLATQATAQKNLNVQDEISMAVITNITDQQKMMAEQLIEMMKQTMIDIYA
jgi:uncharacterized protein YsxB (DUF464 family)